METTAPTVFVIDDDVSFSRALARFLRASGFAAEIHHSAEEFLGRLKPETTGCVITDLMMPGMDGLRFQEALKKTRNPLPLIFLTGRGDIPTTVKAMRCGAVDFLTKQAAKHELLAAVERALARDAKRRAEAGRLAVLQERFGSLSGRERQILAQVVKGKLNKQIAAALGICERTVKLHRTSVTRKLKVQSVAELTRLVQEAGGLDTPT